MNVPVSVLVEKMTKQLINLQRDINGGSVDRTKLREEMQVIKAYCELILDSDDHSNEQLGGAQRKVVQPNTHRILQSTQPKGQTYQEDDANGDSLFDF